ncbi:MAG: signal peptidase II [Elusimicrobia bacterium]|nr:signal peptidase II [Elusimicrobiota bacterium]
MPSRVNFVAKLLFPGVIIVDQVTKFLIRRNFILHESMPFVPFLSITYVENTGIAFGFFQGERHSNLFFIVVSLGVLAVLFISRNQIIQQAGLYGRVAMSLIFGGAVGNLIDRIFVGKVIDFIDVHFWPVFNVADSCITVGGIILFLFFAGILKPDTCHGTKRGER